MAYTDNRNSAAAPVPTPPAPTPTPPSSPGGAGYDPGVNPFDPTAGTNPPPQGSTGASSGGASGAPDTNTIQVDIGGKTQTFTLSDQINSPQAVVWVGTQAKVFESWSTSQLNQFKSQAYAMGLTSSKNPSSAELFVAWMTVVQEAALRQNTFPGNPPPLTASSTGSLGPPGDVGGAINRIASGAAAQLGADDQIQQIIKQASQGGWASINPHINPGDMGLQGTGNVNNSPDQKTQTSSTTYVSFLDPATVQGALNDAYYRLVGRMPTSAEAQAFLTTVYSYEEQANTGKFDTKTTDQTNAGPGGGGTDANGNPIGQGASTDISQNVVSQRGIGQRGLQLLAGNAAMGNPEEGVYQAATTYFNAFIKALSGPAAGMQASGPTVTAP